MGISALGANHCLGRSLRSPSPFLANSHLPGSALDEKSTSAPPAAKGRGAFLFSMPRRELVPRAANAATRANIAERFGWKGLKASGTDSDLSHRLPEADGTPHEQ
jgi:hypothetical protein